LIYDLDEIEEKVILALQKNYTPTRIVTKLEAFNKDLKLVPIIDDSFESKKINISLTTGTEFNFQILVKQS
jgi:hypothetical protein